VTVRTRRIARRFGPQKEALTGSDPSSGQPLRSSSAAGCLNAALRFLSYNATEASLLPTLLHQGAAGTSLPLATADHHDGSAKSAINSRAHAEQRHLQ